MFLSPEQKQNKNITKQGKQKIKKEKIHFFFNEEVCVQSFTLLTDFYRPKDRYFNVSGVQHTILGSQAPGSEGVARNVFSSIIQRSLAFSYMN